MVYIVKSETVGRLLLRPVKSEPITCAQPKNTHLTHTAAPPAPNRATQNKMIATKLDLRKAYSYFWTAGDMSRFASVSVSRKRVVRTSPTDYITKDYLCAPYEIFHF